MLAQAVSIPVYFSHFNDNLEQIIHELDEASINQLKINSDNKYRRNSAISEVFASISANGYQITISGSTHLVNKYSRIPIIQGELSPNQVILKQVDNGLDANNKIPTIILTAPLKTFGIFNEYPLNTDIAIIMAVAEVFSKLYNIPNATPKHRLIFLVTESSSLLNFQGNKKWLDENSSIQNVEFVLCLDTITQSINFDETDTLFMHVSKPPKEGSGINSFYKHLKSVAVEYNNVSVEGVHKKINLADQHLAWEHERFSMKRFPAFTLSSLKSSKHPVRTTIFKDNEANVIAQTEKHAKIIAESLARYVYKIEYADKFFDEIAQINYNLIKSFMNVKSALHNNDIKEAFVKYLKNVKIMYEKPDIREPDFMLYDGQEAKLNVYRVKPAVFDLLLTLIICVYLVSIYFIILNFSQVYGIVCKLTKQSVSQFNGNYYTERVKLRSN